MRLRISLVLLGLACCPASGWTHYHMLLPDSHSVKKDQEVTFTYQFGHPFEHQLFDAAAPESLVVLTPDGKRLDLTKKLEKVQLPAEKDKKVTGYRLKFKPTKRGDYVFVLQTPRIWMAEDKDFIQDTVKVVLHVQTQKNWDAQAGKLELVPLTRPYGLVPGMVFQAEMLDPLETHKAGMVHPLVHAMTEVERYNAKPPSKLPPEEHITRTVKLDRRAKLIASLPEAGWWSLTVTSPHTTKHEADGKEANVRFRSTFWVFVDEARKAQE